MSRIHLEAFGVDAYRWPVAPAAKFRGEPGEEEDEQEDEEEDEDDSDEGDNEADDEGDGYSE